MATSGTATFNLEIGDLIEEAAARAGVDVRSGFAWQGAVRTLNLILSDWASRGLNLFQIDEETVSLVANTAQYTLAADTVDVLDMAVREDGSDYRVDRVGVGTWAQIYNKSQTGPRPNRAWIERLTASTVMHVWPVPDRAGTVVYWRLRRIEDAGTAANNPDVPFRFLPCLTSGLAYYLALKNQGADLNRVEMLKRLYEEEMIRAQSADRGRESFFLGVHRG